MTEKHTNVDKLSKNYGELDTEGKNTLLRIGEKVFSMNNFVSKEISSLLTKKDENKLAGEKLA
jgi:hypothetical protein